MNLLKIDSDNCDKHIAPVPEIIGIEFPLLNEAERFTLKLHFSNGENKKFRLPVPLS